jgi:hypothetical protein
VGKAVGRLAFFASLALTAVGCKDAGPKSPIASYDLTTVNAAALPALMYAEEGYSLDITAGAVELKADSTYSMTITVLENVDGNLSTYTDDETGTWLQGASGAITLTSAGGETFTAAWSGTTLTITRSEVIYAFVMSDS